MGRVVQQACFPCIHACNLRRCRRIFFRIDIRPTEQHTAQWLWSKDNLGLNAQKVRDAFYPHTYTYWQNHRMLNLTGDNLATCVNDRGPPNIVRSIKLHCDDYKVRCLRTYGKPVPDDRVPALLTQFKLETQHLKYRYRVFDGFFPTMQWILRKDAAVNHLTAEDICVFFSYSNSCDAPRDTLEVELTAWLEAIADANREHHNRLSSIVSTQKPLI